MNFLVIVSINIEKINTAVCYNKNFDLSIYPDENFLLSSKVSMKDIVHPNAEMRYAASGNSLFD